MALVVNQQQADLGRGPPQSEAECIAGRFPPATLPACHQSTRQAAGRSRDLAASHLSSVDCLQGGHTLTTSIVEQLKAQLKQLEAERREHEKSAAKIRAKEAKVRKALAAVASLVPAAPEQ